MTRLTAAQLDIRNRALGIGIVDAARNEAAVAKMVAAAEARAAARPAVTLPDCATFVGDGARCAACRIRRPLHA